MKYLKGTDLIDYISERQAKQVRSLAQSKGIHLKLAIINTRPDHLPSQKYLQLKKQRAEDLGIAVDIYQLEQSLAQETLKNLANDRAVHGIILQLPIKDPSQTDQLVAEIPPQKDIDGLNPTSTVIPATVGAILWLLAGYNIELKNKKILIIGQGRLVGAPLTKLLKEEGYQVSTLDIKTSQQDLISKINGAEIIISAAGSPGLIRTEHLSNGQIIIDCGSSEVSGNLVGDVDPAIYDSDLDLKVTPPRGGVGPLTISYLFENLLLLIDKHTI